MRSAVLFATTVWDLVMYVWRTGRWWIGMLIPALVVAAALLAAAKVTVPTIVYAFF